MNAKIFVSILMLCPVLLKAQVFLIDKTDSNFIVNEKMLFAKKDTGCYSVNCINKSDELFDETDGLTPFVFVKAFGDGKKIMLTSRPAKFRSLVDYVKETVIPKLKADLYLRVTDLGTASRGPDNRSVYDSLVIFDGKTYQLLIGIIEVNFYNLLDFKQIQPQQATSTIINIKAKVVPFKMVDGFPQIQVEEIDDYPKLYLINKEGRDYTFSAHMTMTTDDPFNYYREFIYRKGYGIIAFKGKWFYHYPFMGIAGGRLELYDTDKYYYFK